MGSIGGVVRNHKGDFLLGYSEPIGKTTSIIVEITALQRGLDLFLKMACTIFGSKETEKRLKLLQIRYQLDLKKYKDDYKMTHIYRVGNRNADTFARMGHKLNKPCIWRVRPPNEVLRLILNDVKGIINQRIRRRFK
ncbi:hypothetical protein MKX01_038391 [Papaver californicum]|nr:hypothetical protein MKX01_038391 [Papaver californicum]